MRQNGSIWQATRQGTGDPPGGSPRSVRTGALVVAVVAVLVSTLAVVGSTVRPAEAALPTCVPGGSSAVLCLRAPTTDPEAFEQVLSPTSFTAPQVDDYNFFRIHVSTYTPQFRLAPCPSITTHVANGETNAPPVSEMPCTGPANVATRSEAWVAEPGWIGGSAQACRADCRLQYRTGAVIEQAEVVTGAVWNEWRRGVNERGDPVTKWQRVIQESAVTLPAAAPTTPPVAVVDITPTGNADEYRFTASGSYSTTRHAFVSLTHYTFSDGTTQFRQITTDPVVHKFTGPGPHWVEARVTDSRGSTATTRRTVDDHLTVAGVLLGEVSPEASGTTTAMVAVTNDGIGPVTGVRPTLVADPAERVRVTGGPTPSSATLAVGETKEFSFDVATGSAGEVLLTGSATGTGSKGPVSVTSKQITYEIGAADLAVELQVPERVGLKRNDAGELIPLDVDVKVHLRNVSDGTLRNVTLQDGDPVQIPDEGLLGLPFQARTVDPPATRSVASLAPGGEATLTLPYRAVLAGGVDWLARVDATVGEGASERTVTRTAEGRSVVGDEGALLVKLTPQANVVRAGEDWILRGSLKNITNDAEIELDWVRTKLFGNAAGAWVVDTAAPPLIGASRPPTLAPGESWAFQATVHTAIGMDALSAVELAPTGKVVRAGDTTDLAVEDVAFDGPKRVSAQMVTPAFDPSEQLSFSSVIGNFEYSALSTLYEGLVGLRELPRLAADVTANAMAIYGTATRLDFLVTQYELLPKEGRDEWIDAAYGSLEAQYGKGDAVLEGLKAQMAAWFSDVRFAVDAGDVNQLARIGGSASANLFDTELFVVFSKVVQPKWSRFLVTKVDQVEGAARAEAITDASVALSRMEAAATPALAEVAADDLRKALVSGTPIAAESAKLWGVSKQTHEFLAALAKQRGYLITLRARGIGALEKLQQGFLPKMELIKLKNVDPIDVEFLGYLPDDLNTVVLKRPPVASVAEVDGWIAANVSDPAARVGAAERLTTRVEEWAKVQKRSAGYEYLKYVEQGYMPVPFNVAENLALPFSQAWNKRAVAFLKGLQDKLAGKAKFELAAVDGQQEYYRLKVNGRGITGDIDFMDFRKANGEPLTDLERIRLYRDLADGTRAGIVQLQHPETISWFMDSAQWFKTKKKYVEEFAGAASDTLLQYSPEASGSARAVRYDPARSQIEVEGGGNIWRYEGGFTSPARFRVGTSDLAFIGTIASQVQAAIEHLWAPPTTWLVEPGQPGTGAAQGLLRQTRFVDDPDDGRVPVSYRFSTGPDAVVVRAGWDRLEQWTPDGWTPMEPTATDRLDLMPQTALDAPAAKGSRSAALLAPSSATTGADTPAAWFAPGQQVVLDPGGPNEEVRTVASVAPLRFTQALAKDHLAGEMVAVVAAAPDQPEPPTTIPTAPTNPPGSTAPTTPTSTAPPSQDPVPSDAGTTGSPTSSGTLARTGSSTTGLVLTGLALVAAGVLLRRVRRKAGSAAT